MPTTKSTSIPPGLGRVKACNACRQLKLRCDAHEANYGACSRCRKMRRACVFSTTFKRRCRQTKAELQRELERLRAQHQSPPSPPPTVDQSSQSTDAQVSWNNGLGEVAVASNNDVSAAMPIVPVVQGLPTEIPGTRTKDHFSPSSISSMAVANAPGQTISWTSPQQDHISYPSPSTILSIGAMSSASPLDQTTSGQPAISRTMSRVIRHIHLSGRKIDGCFNMFFTHYSQMVPGIFDNNKIPDEVYQESELLFWSIVYVGSRKYSRDPTILQALTEPLKNLLQQSLFDFDSAISTIQASILLCLWPFPTNSTFKDTSHAISGAAMQLAMLKGLPYASRKQDFARVALQQSEADTLFRARLWLHCKIVFQNLSVDNGLPHSVIPTHPNSDQDEYIIRGLAPAFLYRYKQHRLKMEATALIIQTVDLDSSKDAHLLNSLIEQFDRRVQSIPAEQVEDRGLISLYSARLCIRSYHFFSVPSDERDTGLLQVYYIACELLATVIRLDNSWEWASHCNQRQARVLALASVCILRILRSSLRSQVNTRLGEELYFEAIRLSNKRSIQNNDVDSRNATILAQLWSSTRIFKFRDGTVDGLRLLLRGRLFMSVLFDSWWWWRAEFGGGSNPYVEPETDSSTSATSNNQAVTSPKSALEIPSFKNMVDPIPGLDTNLPDLLTDGNMNFDWSWGGFDWDLGQLA